MKRQKNIDILKASKDIKEALYSRFYLLGLSYSDISKDAAKFKINIQQAALSKYFSDVKTATHKSDKYISATRQIEGGIKQPHILWLCARYCVKVRIKVQQMPYTDVQGKINGKQWKNWLNKITPKE